MRLVVTGDRHWRDRDLLRSVLDEELASCDGLMVLIEGEAEGADLMSREWAEDHRVTVEPYPALWDATDDTPKERVRWRRDGTAYDVAAGPIRNQQMIDEGQPERAVAFHLNLLISRGTKDMVTRLEKAAIPIRFVPYDTRTQQLALAPEAGS